MNFFYYESKFIFFRGGEGGDLFYKESKSKEKKNFLGGGRARVSESFFFTFF